MKYLCHNYTKNGLMPCWCSHSAAHLAYDWLNPAARFLAVTQDIEVVHPACWESLGVSKVSTMCGFAFVCSGLEVSVGEWWQLGAGMSLWNSRATVHTLHR